LRAASHPGHDGRGNTILRQIDMRTSSKQNEHTGSKANLELALKWMEKCLQEHKAICGAVSGPSPTLPKRVINVASDPPSLYIGSGECSPYAILSHCWGRNKLKPIRTTADNLSDRCKAIPWDIMPKTYQDAVAATRGLNIKYLWIDSLCILQKCKSGGPSDPDSTRDWLEESLKMEDYYGNATITIEASYATDDTIGCFAKRDPRALLPCDIRIKFPDQFEIVEFTSWLSEGSRAADHWSLPHRRRGRANAPLNRRAWCLQESTMSARILSFEAEQMTWQCFGLQANELVPGGQSLPLDYVWIPPLRDMIAKSRGAAIDYVKGFKKNMIWDAWRKAVEDLTQREIYTGADLLPAISGLAKAVGKLQKLPEENYIAGIWENDLAFSLLWATQIRKPEPGSGDSTKMPRRSDRNPSWSWASIDNGCISFSEKGNGTSRSEPMGEIQVTQTIKIVPVEGGNRFGQISEGRLYLRGGVKKARVTGNVALNQDYAWSKYRCPRLSIEELRVGASVGWFIPDESDKPCQEISVLPVWTWIGDRHRGDIMSGLALSPTGNSNNEFCLPEYRRVGIVTDIPGFQFKNHEVQELALV
jgi:hypothetical protein